MLKLVRLKSYKNSITSRNYTVTNFQTLEDVSWLLRLKEPKKQFQKIEKASFIKKIAKI